MYLNTVTMTSDATVASNMYLNTVTMTSDATVASKWPVICT